MDELNKMLAEKVKNSQTEGEMAQHTGNHAKFIMIDDCGEKVDVSRDIDLDVTTQPADPVKTSEPCLRPPLGWFCTRPQGHDGPCAAHLRLGKAITAEEINRITQEAKQILRKGETFPLPPQIVVKEGDSLTMLNDKALWNGEALPCGLKEIPMVNKEDHDRFAESLKTLDEYVTEAGKLHPHQLTRLNHVRELLREKATAPIAPERYVAYIPTVGLYLYGRSIDGHPTWSKDLDNAEEFTDEESAKSFLASMGQTDGYVIRKLSDFWKPNVPLPQPQPKKESVYWVIRDCFNTGKLTENYYTGEKFGSGQMWKPSDEKAKRFTTREEAVATYELESMQSAKIMKITDRIDLFREEIDMPGSPQKQFWVIRDSDGRYRQEFAGPWTENVKAAKKFDTRAEALQYHKAHNYTTAKVYRAVELNGSYSVTNDHPVIKYAVKLDKDAWVHSTPKWQTASNRTWTFVADLLHKYPKLLLDNKEEAVKVLNEVLTPGHQMFSVVKKEVACVEEVTL